jgi:putative PIN family toxin of toxin-antitoxin system
VLPLPRVYDKVVLDTNVLISAALSAQGVPAQLLDCVLQQGRLVFSAASFAELESRIWRPKFDRYLSLEMRRRLLHDLAACARWVDVPANLAACSWSRDRSDDAFIHTAIAAEVCRLVTGDDDLLCLHPLTLPGADGDLVLHLVTPRQALDEIGAASRSA